MSWPTVSLGEIVGLRTGPFGSALHQHDYVAGGVPLINPTHIRDGRFNPDDAVAVGPDKFRELREFSVEVGDVLMGRRGEMGRCAVVTEAERGWLCGTGSIIVRPTPKVDPSFLQRFLSSSATARALEGDSVGTTMVNLNQKILLALKLALPPLREQRRIAAILDKADALHAKRREAIAKLDQLLQSVFLDMFGDPVTNPKGWQVQKSVGLFRDKPRIGTTRPATGSGIVVVRVGEVGGDEIDFDRCSRAELEQEEVARYALAPGDTVIARAIGSKEQLGKCSYFAGSRETICIDSHVMRLRPDPERCDPLWFNFLLRSPSGKRLLQSKGGATAVQFNVNTTQVSDLDVPLPPIELQRLFSKASERVRIQKQLHSSSQRSSENMFAAIQQRAFSGNL